MHPTHGGRFILELDAVENDEVLYTLELFTPSAKWKAGAQVNLKNGAITFGTFEPNEPPPWLIAKTHAFLRSEWKSRQKPDRAEPWPRRIQRWREE
ncbi:MAG: hypothetical protein U0165_01630 [Polyangiaceae bacterium]